MGEFGDVRIGTAERERALDDLTRHFSAGRLSMAEFDERSGHVAAATTRGELARIFADLPRLTPQASPPQAKRQGGSWDWRAATIAITPIVAVVLFFTLHSWLFFLLIPAVPAVLEAGKRIPGGAHGTD
jgi:hypothetical protein